jgi:L-fucose isomerase-like protein
VGRAGGGSVDRPSLERAARIDLALQAFAHEHDANAIALRCWPEIPDRCDPMACAALGRSGDRGLPAACEGDIWGALSMRVLEAIAGEASALLDLSDLDDARDAILLWHCGNAPASFAAAGTRLTTHFNRDGVGVVRDQALKAGPVTALRILPGVGDAPPELVVIEGEVLPELTPSFDGVRGWWGHLRWAGEALSAERTLASILDARLPHHLALVPGAHGAALGELAEAWGMRLRPAGSRAGFA